MRLSSKIKKVKKEKNHNLKKNKKKCLDIFFKKKEEKNIKKIENINRKEIFKN